MGKAARWFRGLLGLKKEGLQTHSAAKPPKRRWSFGKTNGEKYRTASKPTADDGRSIYSAAGDATGGGDPSKHAIVVAAAAAAVAEAAVTAARKASDVVRLTSSGRCNASNGAPPSYVSQEWAAVKMQAHFRGYLARRALRALKGLVKLQALVRGHIVRKQTADMLRRMQALLRAQARACAGRAHISESPSSSAKSSQFCNPGPATPEKFEQAIRLKTTRRDQSPVLKRNGSKSTSWMSIGQDKAQNGGSWLDSKMEFDQKGRPAKIGLTDDEKSDKILEVDTGKSHLTSRRKNFVHSNHLGFASDQCSHSFSTSKDSTTHQTLPSPSSYEVRSFSPLKANQDIDESPFCTANNSPQFYSASSRGGSARRSPFTPTKSDGLKSYLSGCSDHPNYMACTESSKAKIRSLSAPKQRPQIERSFSTKRYLVYNYGESKLSSQRVSAMHANFVNKAYPGSGRLDMLGMPLLSDGQWNRY